MKKLILLPVVIAAIVTATATMADMVVKDGGGTSRTIKNFVCETTKLCNSTVLIKSDGTEIGTLSSPVVVDLPAATISTLTPPVAISGFATATNQASTNTKLDTSNVNTALTATNAGTAATNAATTATNVGAPGSTACADDTSSCSLNQMLKRLAQSITTLNSKIDTLNTNVSTGAIPAGANDIGGVFNRASTTGGATSHFAISANSNNSTSVKGSAGTVYSIQTSSIAASTPYYLKLYDKATAPTCGTDTPVASFIIPPANSGNNVSVVVGKAFAFGIGYCVVAGIANNDNTSVPAATLLINIDYK